MKKLIYLSLLILVLSACKKDGDISMAGTYTGTFRSYYQAQFYITDSKIKFTGNSYKVQKGTFGEGTFSRNENNIVAFKNEMAYTQQPTYILNGNYTYEVKGDSIILTEIKDYPEVALYLQSYKQYRLKRTSI